MLEGQTTSVTDRAAEGGRGHCQEQRVHGQSCRLERPHLTRHLGRQTAMGWTARVPRKGCSLPWAPVIASGSHTCVPRRLYLPALHKQPGQECSAELTTGTALPPSLPPRHASLQPHVQRTMGNQHPVFHAGKTQSGRAKKGLGPGPCAKPPRSQCEALKAVWIPAGQTPTSASGDSTPRSSVITGHPCPVVFLERVLQCDSPSLRS